MTLILNALSALSLHRSTCHGGVCEHVLRTLKIRAVQCFGKAANICG